MAVSTPPVQQLTAAAALRLVLAANGPPSSPQGTKDLLLGLLLEICSFVCGVLGKQFLRLGAVQRRKYVRPIGVLLHSLGGPLLDAAALAYAAQSILGLFGGLDAVACMFVGPWLNGEKLTLRKLSGAVLITGGTVLAACVGPRDESESSYSLERLPALFMRWPVLVWALLFGTVVVLASREIRFGTNPATRGLAIGCLAGAFDGNSWCLKTCVELLKNSEDSLESLLISPLFLLLFLGLCISAIGCLLLLVRGTKEFETVYLVPLVDGARILSAASSGSLVLNEMQGLPTGRLLCYFLAVLAVLTGIYILFLDYSLEQQQKKCTGGDGDLLSEASTEASSGGTSGDFETGLDASPATSDNEPASQAREPFRAGLVRHEEPMPSHVFASSPHAALLLTGSTNSRPLFGGRGLEAICEGAGGSQRSAETARGGL